MAAGSRMELRVYGHAEPGLPAAVELAAYRIAQEALTNAVRHSGGSHVDVELAVEDREHRLTVRVVDDGIGLSGAEPLGLRHSVDAPARPRGRRRVRHPRRAAPAAWW